MVTFIDPNTFWLNVTNGALGSVTVICCIIVGYRVIQEVRKRTRDKKAGLVKTGDDRLFLSNLGITMADGGECIDKKQSAGSEKNLLYKSKSKSKRKSKK